MKYTSNIYPDKRITPEKEKTNSLHQIIVLQSNLQEVFDRKQEPINVDINPPPHAVIQH
jgi:hypothetical protein